MDRAGQYIYSSVPTRSPATCCLLALWESHTYSISSLTSYRSAWGSHWRQTLRSTSDWVRVRDGLVQAACLLLVAGQVRKLVQSLGSSGSQEAVNRKLRPGGSSENSRIQGGVDAASKIKLWCEFQDQVCEWHLSLLEVCSVKLLLVWGIDRLSDFFPWKHRPGRYVPHCIASF